jgi:adenine-specific DNA-methyltransferase
MTSSYSAESTVTDTAQSRKGRGAFFTPQEVCNFLVGWAVRSKNDKILEPSCGEAEFMLSAASRLRQLGGTASQSCTNLHGVEIHEPSARAAKQILQHAGFDCDIRIADFFDFPAHQIYDVVLGNPPFVRYQQFSGTARAKGLEAALAQGVRLNLLANAWAPFVVHASQVLKPNGRLALVLPAELLTVKYAAEVRRFLLRRFASVKLVMFEELIFPHVLEEVVLLLAEGTGPTSSFELYQARNLADLHLLDHVPWTRFTPTNADKWTSALLSTQALATYQSVLTSGNFDNLLNWGESYLGAVTGNNKYFALTSKLATDLHLKEEELLPISPPGSRHLRGLTFTKKAWSDLSADGNRSYLFYPGTNELSPAAIEYLSTGKATGVDNAYKCRVRKPWWRVPLVSIADLFLTYMDHLCPRLITNEAGVHHLNSLYGVKLRPNRRTVGRDLLPLSSLNSITILGAEMIGRSYGGGILKLEPTEADQLPMPAPELLYTASKDLQVLRPHLAIEMRQGDMLSVVNAVDSVLLRKHLGLKTSELKILRDARVALFSRRTNRGKSISGTN